MNEPVRRTNIGALILDFRDLGRVGFRREYRRPAIVGVGRVPDIREEEDFEGRTMIIEGTAPPDSTRAPPTASVTGMVFTIPYRTMAIRIGRLAANNDIVVADYSVSAIHCELRWTTHDALSIAHIGARNEVWVGKKSLKPRELLRLRGGETIILGRLIFRFLQPDGLLAMAESGEMPTGGSFRR